MSKKSKAIRESWTRHADQAAQEAGEASARAKTYRQRLASGSDDPEADRYLARQAEADHSVAAANERDFRAAAGGRWTRA